MDHDDIIIKMAENFRLDANLIRAIVTVESADNTWANKYEPEDAALVNPSDYAHKLFISLDTEEMNQKTSWGLMQVMGYVARSLGLTDHIPILCDPNIGLFYGCKLLKQLSQRYSEEADIVSAYNWGHVEKNPGGTYANEQYVDKVYSVLRDLRQN